ncbi:4-(cytidine 5'-diphospho)-2-C-methyl-D-erythritol kinase [Primorskyibacter aestuariivivens]|uniref:4-(cytidine 5'-diphospho)-2-C-methyl-D-erythritol kinase n=1 Tax=Primorskyibacter aestuariivivens TaxID=1888912 RepID=UPI0023010FAA|nr:4-(cytidine 5'-diphospho)-2-C-methyl-D-erythritol kinase [Primorskyibacter aestuariivivens]MDA7428249.1 4-(cytidine 5'-diphospho)-2-C-methyl-D-erythritol kinase [Primorskyibacter aestuariivivens]
MAPTEAFAPAKINLTLHVTGQRADGYHLLDSYVVFADFGDVVRVSRAAEMSLRVTGPRAMGVPEDARNLCWRAAEAFGEPVAITLEKHLPAAAGIGGGSSDAAAVLRAMEALFGRTFSGDASALGADVPVCLLGHAARMTGIGETLMPLSQPPMPAVLVNPGVEVSTPEVFRALERKDNPPMDDWPLDGQRDSMLGWLRTQRNDLQAPALALQPVIGAVLAALEETGADIARMSGSGATCFGLFGTREMARAVAERLAEAHPGWWIKDCDLS